MLYLKSFNTKGVFIMIGKWIQKIKKNKRRIGVGALALFLAGVMGVNLLQNSTSTVYAAESQTVVDPDTTNEWTDYMEQFLLKMWVVSGQIRVSLIKITLLLDQIIFLL